jgi:S-adenosyl-L-methionine hydrolase (adenosine-forming)
MLIVTLTTDFGLIDHTAAIAKGQLLQHLNETPHLIDVTHNVKNYDLPQAAYFVKNVIRNFAANTYHCVLVNIFENKRQRLLCVKVKNQIVFCPDNGVINLITNVDKKQVYAVELDDSLPYNLINYMHTISNCINWLQSGQDIESIGTPITDFLIKNLLQPALYENYIEGHIIHIDMFENVATNISRKMFYENKGERNFKIVFLRNEIIEKISESYADVANGEKLAIFNSNGMLEIAINKGNAAGLFGFVKATGTNKPSYTPFNKASMYQNVRIDFYD